MDAMPMLTNGQLAVHKPSGLVVTIGHCYEDSARCKFQRGAIITIKLSHLMIKTDA